MHLASVAIDVAQRLFAAEAAVDAALAETATLAARLPTARSQAYLSAVTGQSAFEDTAAAITALTQARGRLGAAHRTLAALARRLDLDAVAAGPMDKPEDTPPLRPQRVGGIMANET